MYMCVYNVYVVHNYKDNTVDANIVNLDSKVIRVSDLGKVSL